jgi:hypothetical protein
MSVRASHTTGNAQKEPGISSSSNQVHHLQVFLIAASRFHMVETSLVRWVDTC